MFNNGTKRHNNAFLLEVYQLASFSSCICIQEYKAFFFSWIFPWTFMSFNYRVTRRKNLNFSWIFPWTFMSFNYRVTRWKNLKSAGWEWETSVSRHNEGSPSAPEYDSIVTVQWASGRPSIRSEWCRETSVSRIADVSFSSLAHWVAVSRPFADWMAQFMARFKIKFDSFFLLQIQRRNLFWVWLNETKFRLQFRLFDDWFVHRDVSQLRKCRHSPPPLQKWRSWHKRCAICWN